HKTFISVTENGTQAGAATVVEMRAEGAAAEIVEYKEVVLDRPFVYMLVDCENDIPLFIGSTMTVE
ncbi:MAG: serpin, partial [Firmicutes bacterium]|nr:serpin [Bacillota bacterium]